MPTYVDTHTHLDHHGELTPADQVERARRAGVTTLVTVGTDLDTSEQAIQAARAFEGVHAVVGIHPNDAQQATDEALATLAELAHRPHGRRRRRDRAGLLPRLVPARHPGALASAPTSTSPASRT